MNDETPSRAAPLPVFHVLVPVWGAAYCDVFTQVSLPSQLAAGNLPALPHKDRCLYHVLTRPEDMARIEASPAWQQLQALMPARVTPLSMQRRTSYETMSALLRAGIDVAGDADAAILFVNPDLVFADGAIAAVVRAVGRGRRVVFTTGIRLLKETVLPEIARCRAGRNAIVMPPRTLAAIALRNLHPISQQNIWTDPSGTFLPATIFWPVANEGLLARCFHLHPLLVWPERKHVPFRGTIDDDFVARACPRAEADHVVADSDELLMCEISAFSPVTQARYRKGAVDDVADWAESHTDVRHRRLARVPIRIHASEMIAPLWSAAEADSAEVIDAVMARLAKSAWWLLLRAPLRLPRRWLRWATDHYDDAGGRRRIAGVYLAFHNAYGIFCDSYEQFRARLDKILFGPADAPYPWNGHWFTTRKRVEAVIRLLPAKPGCCLIVAPDLATRRMLEHRPAPAEAMAWPQYGVAAPPGLTERWPYADAAFDCLVCVDALAPQPAAFSAEMARVLAPKGRAVIVAPDGQADPPDLWETERTVHIGGPGSAWAARVHGWSEHQRRAHRISPVILEVPLLPLLVALKLIGGAAIALGAWLGDLVGSGASTIGGSAILMRRRDCDARPATRPSRRGYQA